MPTTTVPVVFKDVTGLVTHPERTAQIHDVLGQGNRTKF
jgi:hypothetical protein